MASASRRPKYKIKPPRKHGLDFSSDETWAALSENIREIQKQNAANLSFEENHRFAYNMVLYKHGAMLYDGVCILISEHLENLAKERLVVAFPTGASQDSTHEIQEAEILLKALKNVWDDHVSSMQKLCQILKYMDRVYTKSANVPEIWDAGLDLFLHRIIRSPIKNHVISAILKLIYCEREGHSINRSAVLGCVNVLQSLGSEGHSVYQSEVEPCLLAESDSYYHAEGVKLLETCSVPDYLRKVEHRLRSEEERTVHYLSPQTCSPLLRIIELNLMTPHLHTLLAMPNSGLDAMIDADNFDDLGRLYSLFIMVEEGLQCVRRALKKSISQRGGEINRVSLELEVGETVNVVDEPGHQTKEKEKGKTKPRPSNIAAQTLPLAVKWVQDVLDLKDKLDQIWKRSFQTCRDLESGINEAFESFINLNSKAPEYLSLFIDENLKKGLKGKSEHEVDIVLDKTIRVFRYITDKDVFERYYKGHLAKRLLGGRSVSDDAERGMLAKLKVECGYQFTQKLEGMFHDIKLSNDTMEAYRNHLSPISGYGLELSVTVLTSTFWPISMSTSSCPPPPELARACKSFEQYYFSRHSGRRLTWQLSLGNADIRVAFKAKTHDLNVSTYALIILLLFERLPEDEFLTYEEIKNATSIADNELQRHLQSLACAKFKVLKKHPPGRDVDPSDSFSFNHGFTSPLQKIKISTISSKVESVDERKETLNRVDEERRHQTEACIVRIMKSRKQMAHNDLVNEVTRQLASRFQPNPLSIKKRIEGLIERDYLERCPDKKSYTYLA